MSGFGDNLLKTGTLTGTTAAINIECGFQPSRVEVINGNSGFMVLWNNAMTAAHGLKMDQNNAMITSGGISAWDGDTMNTTLTGTIATTAGSASVTGTSTKALTQLAVGDEVLISGVSYSIVAIASDTAFTLDRPCGATVSGAALVRETGRGPGFTIGTDSDLNTAHTLYWTAWR